MKMEIKFLLNDIKEDRFWNIQLPSPVDSIKAGTFSSFKNNNTITHSMASNSFSIVHRKSASTPYTLVSDTNRLKNATNDSEFLEHSSIEEDQVYDRQHRKSLSTSDICPTFTSDICPTFTSDGNPLMNISPNTRHLDTKNIRKFYCSEEGCSKGFTRRYNLTAHQRCHRAEKPFECNLCNSRFARKHDLTRHKKSIHDENREFGPCTKCCSYFTREDAFERHLKADSCSPGTGSGIGSENNSEK
jgi:uncharacterized Zn-finger protein